jgi:hypothetical protein
MFLQKYRKLGGGVKAQAKPTQRDIDIHSCKIFCLAYYFISDFIHKVKTKKIKFYTFILVKLTFFYLIFYF